MKTRVVFLSAHVKHYRIPFFNALHEALQQDGIELQVVYGAPNSAHDARKDNVAPPRKYGRRVASHWIADRLVLHSAWKEIAGADLVITPNENKLLLNPLLLAFRACGLKRVAFWGKGNVYPAGLSQPGEWFRHKTLGAVDWWFPYTHGTARHLREQGVNCGITAIENSIDTSELLRDLSGITEDCVRIGRVSAGIKEGTVGVFCGNLSANKRLDFLFEAATLVHQAIPEFQLLLLGNGPLCEHVKIVAARNRFIRYIGPRIGVEKALFLKMSDLFLLPGAVGLAVLDAFAAGLPLLTTELPDHGPEVGYLENGRNGLITAHDPKVYAQSVIDLLRDRTRREQLSQAACESGHRHSIEAMVQNFRHGIQECLALPAMRGVPALGAANLLRRSKPLSDRPL